MNFLLPILLFSAQAFAGDEIARGERGGEQHHDFHRENSQRHNEHPQNNFHRENPVIIQGGQQQPLLVPTQESADQIYEQNQGQ